MKGHAVKSLLLILSFCVTVFPFTKIEFARNSAPLPTSSVQTSSSKPKHGGKIEAKYDGFAGETVIALKKMRITCEAFKGMQSALRDACVSFAVSLHCPGQQLDYVRYAKLSLIVETKDWQKRHPLDERDLTIVADGVRFRLGTMSLVGQDVETDRLVDVMREVLEVTVPYKTFLSIARAETVGMRLGKTEFELKDKNMEALRDLASRIKQ